VRKRTNASNGLCPNPVPFKRSVRAGRARDVYDQAYAAWRVGAIGDFYYGTRSDTDDTLVWIVDGTEYAKADTDAVSAYLTARVAAAGYARAWCGERWCGYQALHVVTHDGRELVQRYDGARVIVEAVA